MSQPWAHLVGRVGRPRFLVAILGQGDPSGQRCSSVCGSRGVYRAVRRRGDGAWRQRFVVRRGVAGLLRIGGAVVWHDFVFVEPYAGGALPGAERRSQSIWSPQTPRARKCPQIALASTGAGLPDAAAPTASVRTSLRSFRHRGQGAPPYRRQQPGERRRPLLLWTSGASTGTRSPPRSAVRGVGGSSMSRHLRRRGTCTGRSRKRIGGQPAHHE